MSVKLPFTKMQALGNDFVLVEEKYLKSSLNSRQIQGIAHRRQGIGCDQVILMKPTDKADCELSFYNADGSQALTCGNGTRCVAKYLGKPEGTLQTPSFLSHFWEKGENISISLNPPLFDSPLTLNPPLLKGYRVNIGNPHLVIFTDSLDSHPLEDLGPSLQPPEGINVELAQILSPSAIQVKVWERGVGLTPACGSGACAVGAVGLKLGLIKTSPVSIKMDGGTLEVAWQENSPLLLTGPAEFCFEGTFDLP